MKGRAIGLALAVVLSACGSSSAGTAVLKFNGSVDGSALGAASAAGASAIAVAAPAPTLFQMKLIAATSRRTSIPEARTTWAARR